MAVFVVSNVVADVVGHLVFWFVGARKNRFSNGFVERDGERCGGVMMVEELNGSRGSGQIAGIYASLANRYLLMVSPG